MRIIAFTGVQGLGQTFMEWSFHYLIGQNTYWNMKHGTIPLIDNPIRESQDGYGNAHNHRRNAPTNFKELKEFVTKAKDQNNSNFITCYPHLDGLKLDKEFLEHHFTMIDYMKAQNFRIFEIKLTKPYPYLTERTGRKETESTYTKCKTFVKGSDNIDPKDIKTIREILSFRIEKNRKDWQASLVPYYEKTSTMVDRQLIDHEWRTDTARSIRELIEYTGQSVNEDRFKKWVPIMAKWQVPHHRMVKRYEEDIPMIIDHIIGKKDLDLQTFELGILDQALIMSQLMRSHGRRLLPKSDDFPKNAKIANSLLK